METDVPPDIDPYWRLARGLVVLYGMGMPEAQFNAAVELGLALKFAGLRVPALDLHRLVPHGTIRILITSKP